ncbi:MAG: hypothetical protein QNJ45_00140 [Ardenticatenaceae bacterium]|nr:hypothetical protein [Ardenticatenaceae bacterium]
MTTIDPTYFQALRYRCIGPTRGGRVVTVAADPHDPAVFYFGACAGGVWKTDDGGQFWECISDGFFNTSSIGALAVAPSDPNVIYAGTGETTIRIDVSHGDGVYKSTDAGRSWSHVGLKDTRHIGKIRVHPQNPDLVYVAALGHAFKDNEERGVYRSFDGGQNWEKVLFISDKAGAVDLAMDPHNPRILFATVWQGRRKFWTIDSGGPDSGLWRSMDGGESWENITKAKGLSDGIIGKSGVVISPAKSGRVWAIIEAEGRKRGVYRSDDFGQNWEHTSDETQLIWRPWYYCHIIAHPTDPETVFVLNQKAFVSNDGGKTFNEFTTPHGDNHDLWIDPQNPSRMIGSDDGGAWITYNGGRSWSSIYNQMTAQFYHVNVDNRYPYHVYGTQQDNSSIAIPSRTHTGAISWMNCYAAGTGESGFIAPHPDDHNIVYVGAIGSSPGGGDALQKYDHRTGQIQLVNIWPEEPHRPADARYRFQWTFPIVFSPHDSNVLYAGGNHVFRTTNGGQSWDEISPDLTYADPETLQVSGQPLTHDTAGAETYATIFAFAASPHEQGVLWAGSDDGLVHVTKNEGQSWANVTPDGLKKFTQVTCIEQSPHDPGTVFVSAAGHKMGDYAPHIFKTTDYGQSWEKIVAGLPEDDFVRVVREDPGRPGLLYCGTETGVFVSFDGGQAWQPLQLNLPVSPIYDMLLKENDLVIATHGRSFWILDDVTPLHQLADEVLTEKYALLKPRDEIRYPRPLFYDWMGGEAGKYYHVTLGQNATFIEKKSETGQTERTYLDAGEDHPYGAQIFYYLKEKPEGEVKLTITDEDGNLVNEFSSAMPEKKEDREGVYLPVQTGLNRFSWDMRHKDGEKVKDSKIHGRVSGPLALPGKYTVTLSFGDWSQSQTFHLLLDPRVTTTQKEMEAQLALAQKINDKLNEMVAAVNKIRDVKKQLAGYVERLKDHAAAEKVKTHAEQVKVRLDEIENALIAVDFRPGDSLNIELKLIEKLGLVTPVVCSADAPPTQQSIRVYGKLAAEASDHLDNLEEVMATDVAGFNQLLASLSVPAVV